MRKIIQRRGIIKGLAASALAAPLAQMFKMHTSLGSPSPAIVPKVVFFYTPCGIELPLWHPTQTGKAFTLPRLSAPLQPFQQDCIFINGVSMYPLSDHQGGSQQMLAGDNEDVTTLDLQLGNMLMGVTPFSSLELGVQSRISRGGTPTVPHPHFCRISLSEEVLAEDDPIAGFAQVFGQTGTMTTTPAGMSLLAQQKKSILDTATADLASLMSVLPGSEQQKIQAYSTSLRELELQMTTASSTAASCTNPSFNPTGFTVPAVTDPTQATYNQTEYQGVVGDLQMETARLALACGRTRVVTILYGHTNAHNPVEGLGIFGAHDSSHYTAPPGQLTGMATPAQQSAKQSAWENYRTWYCEKLAQFLTSMKNTPDPTGPGSLLDNTIVMHCSELGDGLPHKTDFIPYVFCGGGNLGFKLGQSLNFNGTVPGFSETAAEQAAQGTGETHANVPNLAHSSLLTLVANVMGLKLSKPFFGYSGAQALNPSGLGII
jgi:hypothetical protein